MHLSSFKLVIYCDFFMTFCQLMNFNEKMAFDEYGSLKEHCDSVVIILLVSRTLCSRSMNCSSDSNIVANSKDFGIHEFSPPSRQNDNWFFSYALFDEFEAAADDISYQSWFQSR
jgi:hypothetical protein